MERIQIGKTGRPHGVKGEIKLFVEDHYEDDLFAAKALLIGEPPMPYFIKSIRAGGSIIARLEDIDQREMATLLSNQNLYLRAEDVTVTEVEDNHPFLHLIDYYVEAADYDRFGPIEAVLDLPEHYLAQVTVAEKEYYVP
ncbi:MAG: hypothetical protein AAF828_04805, partial [Bacteroidota bacterium]